MSETITQAAAAPVEPAAVAAPAPGATLLTAAPVTADPAKPADPAAEPAAPAVVAPVVPEKYEFKAPEGVTFDTAQIDAFSPVAKELGLSNDQAQKLVDIHVAQTQAAQAAQHEAWEAVAKQWADEARADKEIGGVKFDESIRFASKAIDKFGSRELREALDTSKMGNHPAVVRFFVTVGRQLAEDAMLNGNAAQGGVPKTLAEKMFPDLKPY